MDKGETVRHRFAFDKDMRIVDINNVDESMRKDSFFCIGCKEKMIPVLGEKRERHFRHATTSFCEGETYIHRVSKNILKNRFENSDVFEISLFRSRKCDLYDKCPSDLANERSCIKHELQSIDLKKYYDKCEIEKFDPQSNKKPDLCLLDSSGKQPPIWLEIFVSHKCSEEKKSTNNCIIEFGISTEEQALSLGEIKIVDSFKPRLDEYEQPKKTKNNITIEFIKFNREFLNKDNTLDFGYSGYQRIRVSLTKLNKKIRKTRLKCRDICYSPSEHELFVVEFQIHEKAAYLINYFFNYLLYKEGLECNKYCSWCRFYKDQTCVCSNYNHTPKHPDSRYAQNCQYFQDKPGGINLPSIYKIIK